MNPASVPVPDPQVGPDEKSTLTGFLDWYRAALLRKLEGLDREAATRRLVASPTTILGVVKHLAYVERGWFQMTFAGHAVTRLRTPEDPDAEFRIVDDESLDDIVALYRGEVERSRAILAGASLDDHAQREREGMSGTTLRWIVVHMIEETARHCGHLDILRELTDGTVGE